MSRGERQNLGQFNNGDTSMHIRYYQKDGRIGAMYRLTSEEYKQIRDEDLIQPGPAHSTFFMDIDIGLISEEIQMKGEICIQEHVTKSCYEWHKMRIAEARTKRDQKYERMRNVNREIQTDHEGLILRGRIVNHASGGVIVHLEQPFPSSDGCIFKYPTCYAESVWGRHVFDGVTGELTDYVLEDARKALIKLYKSGIARQKHGVIIDLVNSLNGVKEKRKS